MFSGVARRGLKLDFATLSPTLITSDTYDMLTVTRSLKRESREVPIITHVKRPKPNPSVTQVSRSVIIDPEMNAAIDSLEQQASFAFQYSNTF